MKYRKRPELFEAFTFDELVQQAKSRPSNEYGVAFEYRGREVIRVDGARFLVEGVPLTKDYALVWSSDGLLFAYDAAKFALLFEPVPEG